jgi:hypothetical protein
MRGLWLQLRRMPSHVLDGKSLHSPTVQLRSSLMNLCDGHWLTFCVPGTEPLLAEHLATRNGIAASTVMNFQLP